MTAHLGDDALAALALGEATPEARAHAEGCVECGARVEEARAALELARSVEVPEPPGLYWEALRRNVGRRIADEPQKPSLWRWLVPVAATAGAVVVALSLASGPGIETSLPAWSALPPIEDDVDLEVVSTFALENDSLVQWDEGRELGALIADLSEEESGALVEAFRAEERKGEL